MTTIASNASKVKATTTTENRGKGFSIVIQDGDEKLYLGYIMLSNRLDKEFIEAIDGETLKELLQDNCDNIVIQEFKEKSTPSILSKYLKKKSK